MQYTVVQLQRDNIPAIVFGNFGLIKSRNMVVYRMAQEAGVPHREYIDRKKENAIFTHICSSVIPYPIGPKFATEVPAR